jgi:hypothetical protein
MPATWKEWAPAGAEPYNAADNVGVTAAYLAWCLRTAGGEYKGLLAYVWGIGNVLEGRTPPAEATQYANKIIHGKDLLTAVFKLRAGG